MVEADEKMIRQYLLGELAEAEMAQFEERLMTDSELFEMLTVIEDELIDERADGHLSPDEQTHFDTYFLSTPARRERLEVARALSDYAGRDTEEPPAPAQVIRPARWGRLRVYLPLAAAAIVLIAIGLVAWPRIASRWNVSKGMAALHRAYTENPTEARITGLDLPPPSVTRGTGSNKVDKRELNRAELYLDDAIHEQATAHSYHAAGRLYLAKGDFDRAIDYFEQALRLNARDAQLYSDLGAALLEKGKLERDEGGADRGEASLSQSLTHLTRALELDHSLLEALFNRALCYQYLNLPQQAQQDWKTYLDKDGASKWADEARHNLRMIEERKS